MRGRLTIVDQDGRGQPPSGGLGSFDLSKKSAAQLAAELAAQMRHFRQARNKPDVPLHEAASAGSAARSSIARTTTGGLSGPPTDWGIAVATRIDRARRVAAQKDTPATDAVGLGAARRAGSFGEPFKSLLAEGPNRDAIGMRPREALDPPPPAPPLPDPVPAIVPHLDGAAPSRPASSILRDAARGAWMRAGQATMELQQLGIAGWHALEPALRACFDQVRAQVREIGLATGRALRAAWPASKSAGEALRAWATASMPALDITVPRATRNKLAIAGAAAIIIAVTAWLLMPSHPAAPPEAARTESTPAIDAHAVAAASAAVDRPKASLAAESRPPDSAPLRLGQEPHAAVFIPTLTPRVKPVALKPAAVSADTQVPTGATTAQKPAPTHGASPGFRPKSKDPRATDDMLNRMSSDARTRDPS